MLPVHPAIKAKAAGEDGREGTRTAACAGDANVDTETQIDMVVALQHFGEAMEAGASQKRARTS